jgi:hypothetical protein
MLPELTVHFTAHADDNHAAPVTTTKTVRLRSDIGRMSSPGEVPRLLSN